MAIVSNPRTIELEDIQGMVIQGYGKLMRKLFGGDPCRTMSKILARDVVVTSLPFMGWVTAAQFC